MRGFLRRLTCFRRGRDTGTGGGSSPQEPVGRLDEPEAREDDWEHGLIGKRRDFESIHAAAPATEWHSSGGYTHVSKMETTDVEVPALCGFDFHDVRLLTGSFLRADTGEVIDSQRVVIMTGSNLVRAYSDWVGLLPRVNELAAETYGMWDEAFVAAAWRDLCGREKGRGDDGKQVETTLCIEPLTPTGKVKKFPLEANLIISWSTIGEKVFRSDDYDYDYEHGEQGNHGLHLKANYLRDGTIGKGWVDYAHGEPGDGVTIATFRIVGGKLQITKVEVDRVRVA